MKYLYLIFRHFFPRKKWKEIKVVHVFDSDDHRMNRNPIGMVIYLQDQFGNIKVNKNYF